MSHARRIAQRMLVISMVLVFLFGPTNALAAPGDFETVGGHFFGQAGGQNGFGFGVSDAEGAGFWDTY